LTVPLMSTNWRRTNFTFSFSMVPNTTSLESTISPDMF
jgi:hypothetical protein